MAARDFALPPEVESLVRTVCDRLGVPEREHDMIRQLLSTPEVEWPACCRGSCTPCVDEHKSVAREILREAAGDD